MACGDIVRRETVVIGSATHRRGRQAYDLAYDVARGLVDQAIQSLLDAEKCPPDCQQTKRIHGKGFTVERVNAHWRWSHNDIYLEVHLKLWVEYSCPVVPVVVGGGGGGVGTGGGSGTGGTPGSSGGGSSGTGGGSQPAEEEPEEPPPPPPPCDVGCTCMGANCVLLPPRHLHCPARATEGTYPGESLFGCCDFGGKCDLEQGHDGFHHCSHGHRF